MTIDFLSPYSFELEIGKAYNQAIQKCEGWICITDFDTLKPPGFNERIKAVIEQHGDKKRLFGCMTNRVGWNHPAIVPEMFMEDSVSAHLKTARDLWKQHGTAIEPAKVVPGYCMVFHRDLYDTWGPFPDKTVLFDRIASDKSECWLMRGVYILHLYRWGTKDPSRKVEHLKNGYSI